jgi:hypothetical protein
MGDGGSANDPQGLSQNSNSWATKNCCEWTVKDQYSFDSCLCP